MIEPRYSSRESKITNQHLCYYEWWKSLKINAIHVSNTINQYYIDIIKTYYCIKYIDMFKSHNKLHEGIMH